jgi:Uma2 family endonuclease
MLSRPCDQPDATVYPETDGMPEGELQRLITELLRPLLARFLAERGEVAHVGADTFFYWVRGDAKTRLAPDVYVLDGVPQRRITRVWKLWELERPPSFALEIVSRMVGKDYRRAPMLHRALGTRELVVFDPESSSHRNRVRWQVWRRDGDGVLSPVLRTDADRVECTSLGCWLRAVGDGDDVRLRPATGSKGRDLVPTSDERAENAMHALERERAARRALQARLARLAKPRRQR